MQADAWLLDLDETRDAALVARLDASVLDTRERERAAAFVRAADRALYITAHVVLRTVLAELHDVRPEDLVFTREPCPCCGAPHGRPALDAATLSVPPLHFSLSHTRGRILIATAPVPVGADVELRPEPTAVEELLSVLHPLERAEIEAAGDAAGGPAGEPTGRAAAFGRIWARKEAYLKGLGTGLGRAPHLDYVGGAPEAGGAPEGRQEPADATREPTQAMLEPTAPRPWAAPAPATTPRLPTVPAPAPAPRLPTAPAPGTAPRTGTAPGAGTPPPPRHPAGWTLHDLPCGHAHHGAVALNSPGSEAEPPALHRLSLDAFAAAGDTGIGT
ncbi:4'-phosphopantetheinyl transferase family protein [Streptomyces sp. NPDC056632]|uniref:4'-phosphopantetheinyl transferase family protein n=1 Tax=Streptomyces sp. NPDC056632 TaxID=3345884 RepID=UPI0036A8788D